MRRIGALVAPVVAVVVAAGASACASGAAGETEGLQVVVTTSILGDLTERIVGDAGTVEVLVGPGVDPHGFAPSAKQAAALRGADLVVANGLGLEAGLTSSLDTAEDDGVRVLRLAEGLDPLPADPAAHDDHDEHAADGHAEGDPHVWFDPLRMADGVIDIADAVAAVAPAATTDALQQRADALAADLRALHQEVAATLDAVPAARRVLVTNHDNLRYLADRYGFEVIGTVVPGSSTEAQPSAAAFAELADTVRAAAVPAVFAENTVGPALLEALVAEVGRDVVIVPLVTDALTPPDGEAPTYRDLMLFDAARIAEALR